MRAKFSATLLLLSWACSPCPDPPPCPCADKSAADTATSTASAALEETDAGVPPHPFGGKPKEVTEYELHGRAGFYRVNIFEKPDMDTPLLGYMRLGTRTRLGDPEYASESCPKGWYKLKEGGFVCQGRGMLVGTKPRYLRHAPPPPRVDELDPYRHGFIRRDFTPMYKRLPAEEAQLWHPPMPETEVDTTQSSPAGDGGVEEPEPIPHDENEADGGVNYYKYTKKHFRRVRSLLLRGFWVATGSRILDEKLHHFYYETIKGDYVPADNVHLVKPPDFRGYEVLGDSPLPAVLIRDKHPRFYRLARGRFFGAGAAKRHRSYHVHEAKKNAAVTFYRIDNDRWLKSSQVEYFGLRKPPEGIGHHDKWIYIDLSKQTLEAYEGTTPVYVTLVSTGLPDSEETVTPRGRFKINFKHLTNDMTGTVGDDEAYSVEDVPWVQYFHGNIALHASFWHSSYGTPKSHGCVNLAPADARWLFDWSGPKMPEKWHGVAATEKNPGSTVIVTGKTPE